MLRINCTSVGIYVIIFLFFLFIFGFTYFDRINEGNKSMGIDERIQSFGEK